MPATKKRPSKAKKAAQRILNESKPLADKTERASYGGDEFKSSGAAPRTNKTANKPRPDKKRG